MANNNGSHGWLAGWRELARCRSAQGHDVAFLGDILFMMCRIDWVLSIIAINCEAASNERSEALGEGVRISAVIGTVWVSKVGV